MCILHICVCIYIYIFMYAYILCMYIYYIHTFAFIFIYTSVFILVHLGTTRIVQLLVCISSRYAHSHACTWTQPRIYNHASTYTVRSGCSKATHIHTRTHKHINAHKHTHIHIQTHTHTHTYRTGAYSLRHNDTHTHTHGVAAISSLLKIIGLFFKRALSKRLYSAKETYNFKEPSNCSHPIWANTNTNTHTHTHTIQGLACCSTAIHTQTHIHTHINAHTQTYTHTHTVQVRVGCSTRRSWRWVRASSLVSIPKSRCYTSVLQSL